MGLLGKNEKDLFISLWTIPCIWTENRTDKSSTFGLGPADCSREKAPDIVKSDQVRANRPKTRLIFKALLAFGSFCDSYRKGFHSSLTWWPACKLLWESLPPNPYCSIVRKACKQEPPSVTSEWFEQTNIITRVFMEKCLSTEAERA